MLAVVLDAVTRADDLPAEVCLRCDALADAEERRPRAAAAPEQISSTRGVTSGSGPSSIVTATAVLEWSRVALGPSQRLRGQRPMAVSSR